MPNNKRARWLAGFRDWASDAQSVLENVAKGLIIIVMLGSMLYFGHASDPGKTAVFADRILAWSFAVFAVGLAELFVLFVVLSVLGKIDLAQAFYDKAPDDAPAEPAAEGSADDAEEPVNDPEQPEAPQGKAALDNNAPAPPPPKKEAEPANAPETPPVSLSRLQAFMWTLVVMTIYFHRVVKDGANGIPPIPPELLMVMGISGATYLISKNIDATPPAKPKPKPKPEPKK